MNSTESTKSISKAVTPSRNHKLSASRVEEHPESFYDESSSHYMGGAHNRLIESAKTATKSVTKSSNTRNTRNVPSQKSMGGAHNVALAVLTE